MSIIAWREAPELSLLRLQGADCADFLQGYVTCDASQLDESWQGCAFTTLKGRVLATAMTRRTTANTIDIVFATDLTEALTSFLSKYLAFARSTLSRTETAVAVALGTDDTHRFFEGAALYAGIEHVDGAPELTEARWQQARIDAGVPWIVAATSEQFLPQMLGLVQLGWVRFDKGCYLGQEVVARAEHRGAVKRQMQRLASRTTPPPIGSDVLAAGKRVGVVIDAAPVESSAGSVVLAVVATSAEGALTDANGAPLSV